jgi:hypothetical protein
MARCEIDVGHDKESAWAHACFVLYFLVVFFSVSNFVADFTTWYLFPGVQDMGINQFEPGLAQE